MYILAKAILQLEDAFLSIDFREKYIWLERASRIENFFKAGKVILEHYRWANEGLIHPLVFLIYLRFLDYLQDAIENSNDEDIVKLAQHYRSEIKVIVDMLLEHATDNARELLEPEPFSHYPSQELPPPPPSRIFDDEDVS
jgi:hypothetical protein